MTRPDQQPRGAATATYHCKGCGDPFRARTADRKRGWARYCSKSCKAKVQTAKTGRGAKERIQLANGGYLAGAAEYDRHGEKVGEQLGPADMSSEALGQWS